MSSPWESLVTLNERLRPLNDPVAIQEAAVGLLAAQLQASRVQYAQIDGDDFVLIKACDADGISPLAFRGRVADFVNLLVIAIPTVALLLLVFPDGRFVPHWTRWLVP